MIVTVEERRHRPPTPVGGASVPRDSAEVLVVVFSRGRLIRRVRRFIGRSPFVGPVTESRVALDQMDPHAFAVRGNSIPRTDLRPAS